MSDFERLAEKFGHDLDAIKAGNQSTRRISINHIDELRDLLAGSESKEDRAARAVEMKKRFGPDMDPSNRSEQAILRRAEAYVMADVPMSDEDQSTVAHLFPMEAASDFIPKMDLNSVKDLGTSVAPYFLWVGTLNINPGGALRIQNSVLKVLVDTLNIVGGSSPPSSVNYHLGIFGATGAIGAEIPPPSVAQSGSAGRDADCSVSGSEPGQPSSKGLTGSKGATGTFGNPGGPGKPSLPATITIKGMTGGQFVIKTTSGTGGRGGTGGPGQQGGPGGRGGNGIRCECTGVDASNGGKGGTGGRGGTGGTGGKAIAGSDIYVIVPDALKDLIVRLKEPAPVGQGGPGGVRGKGGTGGAAGTGDKHATAGATGAAGNDATDGLPGAGGPGPEGVPGEIYINNSAD
ncbi:MAG TPA: hypothetical protein VJM50_23425 [Pyrinomonadaceae bacterium]|nr:hypothetical protein [Pyrinomonadaceae bacterium]